MPAGLVFIRQLLRQEPLIAMGFRFRRSTRLGPLRFNYRFAGLRLRQGWFELHLRWRAGCLVQYPHRPRWWCSHHGGATGNWVELERGARAGSFSDDPCRQSGRAAQQPPAAARSAKGYLLRSQGQDDVKRRAQRCIEAAEAAVRLVAGKGVLS